MERCSVCIWKAIAAGLGIWSCIAPAAFSQAPQVGGARAAQLAQNRPRRAIRPVANGDDEAAFDGVFLPPDRTAKRRLELAQQLLAEKRYGETLRLLGSLLENPEDYFFKPDPEEPVYRSLKAEASSLIAAMPAEGLDSYELQFGARARQMLKQATTASSLAEVAEVSRRFFFTQAGQEATYLLGRHHLDDNRPLTAALCFERLRDTPALAARFEPALSLELAACWLRAGNPLKAQEALVRLKRSHGGGEIVVAGKPVKFFANEAQALTWMQDHFGRLQPAHPQETEQWAMFRGDETRNAASTGGQPLLSVRWRQRTSDDRSVEKVVDKMRADYLSQEIPSLPSLHPLALGDVVVMRTAFALQAVDFHNGKLVWRYPSTDDSLEQFLKAGNAPSSHGGTPQVVSGLNQRMWEDAIYGTLSSDGSQVYFIEDLGLAGVTANVRTIVLPGGQRRESPTARNTNRLSARELRTQGKLKWEVGGLTGEDEPKLAGAFFLGPPLPLQGRLYALAEMKGQEIRLVVLSAKTGALEWSQQLAVVEPTQSLDSFRRNAGAVPSFADGILVCPTAAGAIVALDLTTRSLLWGYQYPRSQPSVSDRLGALRLAIYSNPERRPSERWTDGTVTIADGRVLITPVENDQLYCLNLADGKELWKQPRENNLYVACVHAGNVILVGRDAVSAVRLADGQRAWPQTLDLPSGSMPSGRGFYSSAFYYLPLSSAEVAKINLQSGQIEQRARSRSGHIPGNLICFRDSILSQGVDYLDAYFQLDALKQQIAKTLADRPDDPQALAELAEVKLDEGSLGGAIELFRRSYQLNSDETTRQRLVDSLLEGLRLDFSAYRPHLPELETLVDRPRDRLALQRFNALGLQAAGEVTQAFETYMKLANAGLPAPLDMIDDHLSVRRDRWIREQLATLYQTANAEQRAQMDATVDASLKSAQAAQLADALRYFLGIFAWHPTADAAREALVARLDNAELLERVTLLRTAERSSVEAPAGAATAWLAQLLRETGRPELSVIYYRQLATRFATVPCRDGKTGQQWVDQLPADDPVRKGLAADAGWPQGQVTSREDKVTQRNVSMPKMPRPVDVEIVGPQGPMFDGVTLSFDQKVLVAEDGFGDKRFRVRLDEPGSKPFPNVSRYNGYTIAPLSYASVSGGLVVLSTGNQLMAIDAARGVGSSLNRVLWTHDVGDQIGGFALSQGLQAGRHDLAWGGRRFVAEDVYSKRVGTIGPVNDDGVYFQRQRDLHCVDPLSGKTIWIRKNVGLGNDLFGDQELVFVAPPGDGEMLVLRAATGELLGTRRVAPFDNRMATIGRSVLSWETQGAQVVMQMRDPWQDHTQWSYSFAPGSKAALVSQEAVGVLQPDGEFTLVTLADGKTLVKERLEPENHLLSILLLRSREGYLLVTNTTGRGDASMQPAPNGVSMVPINGRIYAFERGTGKKLWPAPAIVSQYNLLSNQPAQLPALVFVRQFQRPGLAGSQPKTSIMCLDKRTGRVVHTSEQPLGAAATGFEISGDPVAHTMTLAMPQTVITLTFTAEAPDAQAATGLVPLRQSASRTVGAPTRIEIRAIANPAIVSQVLSP